jgi:hypothetical protein
MKRFFQQLTLGAVFSTMLVGFSFAQTAGQDIKNAGHDTADATKKVAHKTATTTKKGANKAAHATKKGASKVEQKTDPK